MTNQRDGRIWIALLAVYIVWGSTYLAIRFAVETIPPFIMAGTRFLIAGGILYIWRRLAGDPLPRKIEWRSAFVIGFFLLVAGNGSVTWAEQRVESGIAALLVASAPLWMVLMDALRRGGRWPRLTTIIGVLIGFFGIALLIGPAQIFGGGTKIDPLGIAALMLAAFMWALGSIYSRGATLPESPLMGTAIEMLLGGLCLYILGSFSGEWNRLDFSNISLRSLSGLIYLIFFGALVGFVAYTWLLRVAPTPLVATYAYVNPIIAVIIGNLLANEPLNLRIGISAVVIISSVVLINSTRTQLKKARDSD